MKGYRKHWYAARILTSVICVLCGGILYDTFIILNLGVAKGAVKKLARYDSELLRYTFYKILGECIMSEYSCIPIRSYDRAAAKSVAINSSTGGIGPLPVITTLFADPLNVVTTSIDTNGMSRTINLLNFTSIINLPLGVSVTLNFEVLRTLEDGSSIKVGPTFTYSTIVDVLEAEAFGFQYADTNVAPGNYTYSVQISTNSIIDFTPGASVNNATLSIVAANIQ